ncbi:MAG: lysophospholipid acyltransferase family protein [Deltaproteobacteria bacterium]|nr:lysophospholipid acyltransferase family protein [Deltaproteobacteria bacterium]
MHRTVFSTHVIKSLLYWISLVFLKVIGWRKEGKMPDIPQYVIIAAPHTTNWDLPITLALAFSFKCNVYWMGKDTIFKLPFGAIMKFLGGISIDRSTSSNVVEQSIQAFRENNRLVLVIPPEGTRQNVSYWKTGFYYIANGANVPIVMGFLDYKRKVGGIGHIFQPTGDIDADMVAIQSFYATVSGKYPEKSSLADISPDIKGFLYRKAG